MACSAAIIRRYKTREQVQGYLASRGFQRTLEEWRNGRWIGHVSRDGGGFSVEVWLPTAYGSSFEREHLVTEQDTPDSHDDGAAPFRGSQTPVVRFETLVPFRRIKERTFLAWIRTGAALIGFGLSPDDVFRLASMAAFRWSLPDLASLGAISRTPDCWE